MQGKPSILFILTDDLGYGDLSSYVAKDINTPNIDNLVIWMIIGHIVGII